MDEHRHLAERRNLLEFLRPLSLADVDLDRLVFDAFGRAGRENPLARRRNREHEQFGRFHFRLPFLR